jgi:DNA-directed RNA polymerase subunit RPC12/RpoP
MKYLIVVALLLCSAVCWGEDYGNAVTVTDDSYFKIPEPPTYICEKCGRETQYPFQFGTNEDYGRYCPYCMKEIADKYLPKATQKGSI